MICRERLYHKLIPLKQNELPVAGRFTLRDYAGLYGFTITVPDCQHHHHARSSIPAASRTAGMDTLGDSLLFLNDQLAFV